MQPSLMVYPEAKNSRLSPILKWPGGKTGELELILSNMPHLAEKDRYYEPFLGGGAVFLSIPFHITAFANDISNDLMALYSQIANRSVPFFDLLELFRLNWVLLRSIVEENRETILSIYKNKTAKSELEKTINEFTERCRERLLTLFAPEFNYDIEHFFNLHKSGLVDKISRMRDLEKKHGLLSSNDVLDNVEGALKAAFYTYIRHLYNNRKKYQIPQAQYSAIFYFIRENAYASMFRFNSSGGFNIPYGGISYNRKDLGVKIEKMKDENLIRRLQTATLTNMDFFDFLEEHPPQPNDFLFLDPPYDTEFSDYDGNPFRQDDQKRLADYLVTCPARFMLVIKSTDYILELYRNKFNIKPIDKKYMYTVKERNNRDVIHLMITNY